MTIPLLQLLISLCKTDHHQRSELLPLTVSTLAVISSMAQNISDAPIYPPNRMEHTHGTAWNFINQILPLCLKGSPHLSLAGCLKCGCFRISLPPPQSSQVGCSFSSAHPSENLGWGRCAPSSSPPLPGHYSFFLF